MTADEKLDGTRGRRFVVTWAPHVKPLPMAVAHSAVLSAAAAGMHVTVAHPPGYDLHAGVLEHAARWCRGFDTQLTVSHAQKAACTRGDVVYVKSWGSARLYRDAEAQTAEFRQHANWTVDTDDLGAESLLMHCLPVRRNVVISDAALDDPRCVVVDQAENRMWTQAAVLSLLLSR
jgi:N-acetylornithine carbamoyltransferase